jgi:hypothetical protein
MGGNVLFVNNENSEILIQRVMPYKKGQKSQKTHELQNHGSNT